MAGENRTARVILSYEVDRASAKAAQDSVKRLKGEMTEFERAFGKSAQSQIATDAQVREARVASAKETLNLAYNIEQQKLRAIEAGAIAEQTVEQRRRQQRLENARELLSIAQKAENERLRIVEAGQQAEEVVRKRGGSSRGFDFLGGRTFREIGFQLRSIPGGGIPETLGRLSPLADVAAELATGTGKASLGLVGVTGGLVALGVILTETSKYVRAVGEAEKDRIKILQDAERFALQNTKEAVQQRVESLSESLRQEQAILDQAGAEREAKAQQLGDAGLAPSQAYNPLAVIGVAGNSGLLAEYRAVNDAYETQSKIVRDLAQEQLGLNQQLLVNATRVADERAEIERGTALQRTTAEQRQQEIDDNNATINSLNALHIAGQFNLDQDEVALRQIDALIIRNALLAETYDTVGDRIYEIAVRLEQFNTDAQDNIRIQGMDAEQRQERIFEIQREMAVWEQYSEGLSETDERYLSASEHLQQLNSELYDLEHATSTYADVLKYANGLQDNLNDSTDAYFDSITQSVEDAQKASKDWTDAQQDNLSKLADLLADANAKDAEAQRKAAQDLADLDADRNEKIEKQQEDHNERLAKLQRDAARDIADAIGARDALALFKRREKLAEDIADEKTRNEKALKQVDDAYKKQQETIKKRLDEQLRTIENAYEKAVEAQERRFAEERAIYQQAMLQQRADLTNQNMQLGAIQASQFQNSLFRTQNYYQTASNIQDVYLNSMLFRAQAFFQSFANLIPTAGGSNTGTGRVMPSPFSANAVNAIVDRRMAEMTTAARGRGR